MTSLCQIIESLHLGELSQHLPYEGAKAQASESWETKSGSVFTLRREGYELGLVYDHGRRLTGATIDIDNPGEPVRRQLSEMIGPSVNIYHSEGELVVFLTGDKVVRVLATSPGRLRIKVTTPVSEVERELVRRVSRPAGIAEVLAALSRA